MNVITGLFRTGFVLFTFTCSSTLYAQSVELKMSKETPSYEVGEPVEFTLSNNLDFAIRYSAWYQILRSDGSVVPIQNIFPMVVLSLEPGQMLMGQWDQLEVDEKGNLIVSPEGTYIVEALFFDGDMGISLTHCFGIGGPPDSDCITDSSYSPFIAGTGSDGSGSGRCGSVGLDLLLPAFLILWVKKRKRKE